MTHTRFNLFESDSTGFYWDYFQLLKAVWDGGRSNEARWEGDQKFLEDNARLNTTFSLLFSLLGVKRGTVFTFQQSMGLR